MSIFNQSCPKCGHSPGINASFMLHHGMMLLLLSCCGWEGAEVAPRMSCKPSRFPSSSPAGCVSMAHVPQNASKRVGIPTVESGAVFLVELLNGLGWKGPSRPSSFSFCHGQGRLPLGQGAPSSGGVSWREILTGGVPTWRWDLFGYPNVLQVLWALNPPRSTLGLCSELLHPDLSP